jgi:hypothetical protein
MTREPEFILATDCGSTTTKAILFARRPEGYRLAFRGEAPTTVEAPFDDVVAQALRRGLLQQHGGELLRGP